MEVRFHLRELGCRRDRKTFILLPHSKKHQSQSRKEGISQSSTKQTQSNSQLFFRISRT